MAGPGRAWRPGLRRWRWSTSTTSRRSTTRTATRWATACCWPPRACSASGVERHRARRPYGGEEFALLMRGTATQGRDRLNALLKRIAPAYEYSQGGEKQVPHLHLLGRCHRVRVRRHARRRWSSAPTRRSTTRSARESTASRSRGRSLLARPDRLSPPRHARPAQTVARPADARGAACQPGATCLPGLPVDSSACRATMRLSRSSFPAQGGQHVSGSAERRQPSWPRCSSCSTSARRGRWPRSTAGRIGVADLKKLYDAGAVVVVDVRAAGGVPRLSHLAGALSVPLDRRPRRRRPS